MRLTMIAATIGVIGMALAASSGNGYDTQRRRMVETQIEARGVEDPSVLEAMQQVPRHRFVPEHMRAQAYSDSPLPIGENQTISQPYIVAFMTEALGIDDGDRVLEVGTGSGYQAAVLAEIAAGVYTIERIEALAERARRTLDTLGYDNVHVRTGDGYKGWEEHAPYDAVIVTAAPDTIPQPLIDQLKTGGRIVIPVGPVGSVQHLIRGVKTAGGLETSTLMPVRFVPMVDDVKPAD